MIFGEIWFICGLIAVFFFINSLRLKKQNITVGMIAISILFFIFGIIGLIIVLIMCKDSVLVSFKKEEKK